MWTSDFRSQISHRKRSVKTRQHLRAAGRGALPRSASAAWLLLTLSFLTHPAVLFPARGLYEVREIKPNVFVWIPEDVLDQDGDARFSRAGTAGFIITREAVVVVDTTNSPFHARELLYEIRRRTEAPVKYVVNTCADGDHVMGNEVFVDQQATILSTTGMQEELRRYGQELNQRIAEDWRMQARMRGIHLTLPNQTFDREMVLRFGGEEIKVVDLGSATLRGESAVYLPSAKVLFLGRLFTNHFYPRVGSEDIRQWIGVLRQLESWDVETYVPGHGEPGDKKSLGEFRQFLEWLTSEVESRIEKGQSLTRMKQELLPFENYRWHAPELALGVLDAVYSQLAREQNSAK